ncbi:MAG: GntR family transcriptional regulator [Planctomycetia bacterium]|nr:GntR family transcriptional regulator [Planctomycetia bacterium]
MKKTRNLGRAKAPLAPVKFRRVERPLSMVNQVELALRQAIAENRFPSGKLPTEVELAEQLGVSRETVRLAEEALQREGLLIKIRRRGTFTQPPRVAGQIKGTETQKLLGYLQTDFTAAGGAEEVANRAISGLILQGVVAEAGASGYRLVVQHTPHLHWRKTAKKLTEEGRLLGLICASYDEEKMLRNIAASGLPTVLVDGDTNVPRIHSVRDDSFESAREAIRYLAQLGHRRIAYANWARVEMNPVRPLGYRKGLRDAGLSRRRRWEILTELTEAGAATMIDELLSQTPRPTALYCFNNTLAKFAIAELRRRALRVPEDMSVVGAGGEDVPELTCHQVDWYAMGRTAVQILLRAIAADNRARDEHYLYPHTLRPGRTTAAPRSDTAALNPRRRPPITLSTRRLSGTRSPAAP